jgi:hypothetical protein
LHSAKKSGHEKPPVLFAIQLFIDFFKDLMLNLLNRVVRGVRGALASRVLKG